MTVRLFDKDSHILNFTAEVLSCESYGIGFSVILNETAFAPEAGGQPSDLGTIAGIKVLNVIDGEELRHILPAPLEVGQCVDCRIDADRRLRHMQNHSAEHILSGLFYREYGLNNVGFHLGHEEVTFDLDGEVTEEMLRRIELLANRAVAENHAVHAYYPTEEELAALFYRSKGALEGKIRIVEIEGVDACACCVPHVKFTGEIGGIRLLNAMRYKGGTRIWMAAGLSALEVSVFEQRTLDRIGQLLSLPHEKIEEGVKKLHDDLGTLKFALEAQKRERVRFMLEHLQDREPLVFIEPLLEVSHLRALAIGAFEKTGKTVAAFSGKDGEGYAFVLATKDFDSLSGSLRTALSARGGGRAPVMQGTAACTEAEIRSFFIQT